MDQCYFGNVSTLWPSKVTLSTNVPSLRAFRNDVPSGTLRTTRASSTQWPRRPSWPQHFLGSRAAPPSKVVGNNHQCLLASIYFYVIGLTLNVCTVPKGRAARGGRRFLRCLCGTLHFGRKVCKMVIISVWFLTASIDDPNEDNKVRRNAKVENLHNVALFDRFSTNSTKLSNKIPLCTMGTAPPSSASKQIEGNDNDRRHSEGGVAPLQWLAPICYPTLDQSRGVGGALCMGVFVLMEIVCGTNTQTERKIVPRWNVSGKTTAFGTLICLPPHWTVIAIGS